MQFPPPPSPCLFKRRDALQAALWRLLPRPSEGRWVGWDLLPPPQGARRRHCSFCLGTGRERWTACLDTRTWGLGVGGHHRQRGSSGQPPGGPLSRGQDSALHLLRGAPALTPQPHHLSGHRGPTPAPAPLNTQPQHAPKHTTTTCLPTQTPITALVLNQNPDVYDPQYTPRHPNTHTRLLPHPETDQLFLQSQHLPRYTQDPTVALIPSTHSGSQSLST